MYSINGFGEIVALSNNTSNATATFGELSPRASTFSREKSLFGNAQSGDVTFVGFSCFNNTTSTTVPSTIGNEILQVLNWLYNEAKNGDVPNDQSQLVTKLTNEYGFLSNFSVGAIVTTIDVTLPEWIYFKNTTALGGNTYEVKVWFSNNAFEGQYTNYEIIVIPPVTNVDNLFNTYGTVGNYLAARTQNDLVNLIQTASGNKPYTLVTNETFTWVSSINANMTLDTNWVFIVYGPGGANLDAQKEAAKNYILENTTHSEVEWKTLIPSLFVSTEYIVTPHWNRYAIPNQTVQGGLYSSNFGPSTILDYANLTKGDYPTGHVNANARGGVFTYKTIAFSIVGNIDNINEDFDFTDKFRDYIPVPSTSLDFGRMSLKTQQWSLLMNEMLPIAEAMTPSSNLPISMSRKMRDGKMYLGKSLDGVLYLMVSKQSIS